MSSTVDQVLGRAFELIENNRQSEALSIIQPILQENQNNPDVWWIYAHAVEDVETARDALGRVLRIDPGYPGAGELSRSLEAKFPLVTPVSSIKHLKQAAPVAGVPSTLPDLPDVGGDDLDFDLSEDWEGEDFEIDLEKEPGKRARRRLLIPLAFLVLIVIAVVAIVILSSRKSTSPKATPTSGAQVSAATATWTEVVPVTEANTSTPIVVATAAQVSEFGEIYDALLAYNIPDQGIEFIPTDLGNTLRVTACSARDKLADVMAVVADKSRTYAAEIDGIAVTIGDCTVPGSLRTIGVEISDVLAYLDGNLSDQDFRRLWRPVSE